jgi:hypothetical protein
MWNCASLGGLRSGLGAEVPGMRPHLLRTSRSISRTKNCGAVLHAGNYELYEIYQHLGIHKGRNATLDHNPIQTTPVLLAVPPWTEFAFSRGQCTIRPAGGGYVSQVAYRVTA